MRFYLLLQPFFLVTSVVSFTVLPSKYTSPLRPTQHITETSAAAKSSSKSPPSKSPEEDGEASAKRAALDGVMNQIEKSYGRGSIVKLGDGHSLAVATISTGALTLDAALGKSSNEWEKIPLVCSDSDYILLNYV